MSNNNSTFNTNGDNLLQLAYLPDDISCRGDEKISIVGVNNMVANGYANGWVSASSSIPVLASSITPLSQLPIDYQTGFNVALGLYMTAGKIVNIKQGDLLARLTILVTKTGQDAYTFTLNVNAGRNLDLNLNTCTVPATTTVTLPPTRISQSVGAFGTPINVSLPINCTNTVGTLSMRLSWAGDANDANIISNTASNTPAKGIGIILTTNSNTQITNNMTFSLFNNNSNTIAFTAQYYSFGAQASGGVVQGTVNLSVVYR